MFRILFLALLSLFLNPVFAQYNWKLEKQKNGISVYLSDVANSNFKAVKVEFKLTGTYAKLNAILTNLSNPLTWKYK